MEPPLALSGREARIFSHLVLPGALLWAVSERSWAVLDRLGARLGPFWGFSGRSGSPLGRCGAVLGASWAVLERGKPEKARTLKTLNN